SNAVQSIDLRTTGSRLVTLVRPGLAHRTRTTVRPAAPSLTPRTERPSRRHTFRLLPAADWSDAEQGIHLRTTDGRSASLVRPGSAHWARLRSNRGALVNYYYSPSSTARGETAPPAVLTDQKGARDPSLHPIRSTEADTWVSIGARDQI
ncbi:hypothetical protein THAOC_24159, partial [Thalassiosira oceanica]